MNQLVSFVLLVIFLSVSFSDYIKDEAKEVEDYEDLNIESNEDDSDYNESSEEVFPNQVKDEDNMKNNRPQMITDERMKEIRSDLMYWYTDEGGNDNKGDYQMNIHPSSPQLTKNLNFELPFFGFRYTYTSVSMNGYLEFTDPPEYYSHYPLVFPIQGWPENNDPSFIGIFYSKTRIGALREHDKDKRMPGVYYRMESDLQTRNDEFAVELRQRLKLDILEEMNGEEIFEPKHAIIVTWKNITFAGGIVDALFRTNTFQTVLATDEISTYCIFNYLDLTWTTHTDAGGDTATGEGGVPAFVGFNAGYGIESFEYHPYSQSSSIRDLTKDGCTTKGRHIFKIDEKITPICKEDNKIIFM